MKERYSNFELLRIVSIVLILLMHSYSQIENPLLSVNRFMGSILGAVGNIGVSLFILLSGYFKMNFKSFRFVQLILLTTLYSIIVHIINYGIKFDMGMVEAILVIPLYNNWFITCYLILMLICPWLNTFIETQEKGNYVKLLFLLFIVFSVIPTLLNTPYYTILTGGGKVFNLFYLCVSYR